MKPRQHRLNVMGNKIYSLFFHKKSLACSLISIYLISHIMRDINKHDPIMSERNVIVNNPFSIHSIKYFIIRNLTTYNKG